MENLVCAIHRDPAPHQRRAELLAAVVQKRDAGAAADLVALDAQFPVDWWNKVPYGPYLKHDLPAAVEALALPEDDVRRRAILCAGACAVAKSGDAKGVMRTLTEQRILVDPAATLPEHGGILSVILGAVERSAAMDAAKVRGLVAARSLALARKGRDGAMWNVAIHFAAAEKPNVQIALEREAWQATGEAKFAAGLFTLREKTGLRWDDAELTQALKQFPEDAWLHAVRCRAAQKQNAVTKPMIAEAAQAEFHHFSNVVAPGNFVIVDRPRSDSLRAYFGILRPPPAAPAPPVPKI